MMMCQLLREGAKYDEKNSKPGSVLNLNKKNTPGNTSNAH